MKRIILLVFLLSLFGKTFAQEEIIQAKNLRARNPMNYPYGINIDMTKSVASPRWAREFNFSYDEKGNIFSFGAVATGTNLEYGYIGGNNKNSTTNHPNPWMTFLPNGNIGIGTIKPSYRLHVEGDTYTNGWFRANGNSGIFFQTWGGGFYMTDPDWIRTYNNKNFYHNTGIMRTDGIFQVGNGGNRLLVNANGNVGIGSTNPQAKLDVAGTIRAREVKIEVNAGADFVFEPSYTLRPLSEVESFVKENKHLPEIPSEKQMIEEGVSVNELQIKLLQKIEELTLYVIDLDQKDKEKDGLIKELQKENQVIKKQLNLE